MGLIGQLLGQQQKVQIIQGGSTVISVDCTMSESHSRSSPPSEFPIESGLSISDNILVKPFELEINGIVSDTPLSLQNALITSAVSAILPPIGVIAAGVGSAIYSALQKSKSPSVAAFGQLLQLQDSKKPFDVLTSLRRYENMFIKDLKVPRDANTGQILNFTLTLVQLIIVAPQTVNITIFGNGDVSANEGDEGQKQLDSSFFNGIQSGLQKVTDVSNRLSL